MVYGDDNTSAGVMTGVSLTVGVGSGVGVARVFVGGGDIVIVGSGAGFVESVGKTSSGEATGESLGIGVGST